MIDADTLNEIQELNMTYLLLAKQLLLSDREAGIFRLGISDKVAGFILALSAKKMSQIAKTNQFVCKLRFEDIQKLEATVTSQREYVGTPGHHSLFLASQIQEQ